MASEKVTTRAESTAVAAKDARALLALIERAAEAAASVIRAATPRRSQLNWQEKGVADFVTEVDENAQAAAMAVLREAEPGAHFIAEEGHVSSAAAPPEAPARRTPNLVFVIDPLDGTTNFLHGLPEYAVSIAAVLDGALAAGIVLNVPRHEHFTAAAGCGARLGEDPIHVSEISNPIRSLIGTGFPFKNPSEIPAYLPQMAKVMEQTSGVRRPGSASIDLANVAAGRLDGFWENFLSPWDIAAGVLLVREAGGVCTDPGGKHSELVFGPIVAGNPAIHAWLLRTLFEQ